MAAGSVECDAQRSPVESTLSPLNGTDADAHLVRRLALGEVDAVASLYDRYAARVMGLAFRILRHSGDAEDVVQEVFAQAWRSAPGYEGSRGTVAGWLLMMARTRAIDKLRARRARGDVAGEPIAEAIPANETPQPDRLIADEQAALMRGALVALPAEQRQALELAYFEGLTQSEIAAHLSTPLGTVKTRIRTALIALRRSLRP